MAVALARAGCHVVLTARTQGGLEETDDAVQAVGGTATLLPLDLTEGAQLDAIGPSLLERFGRLDILVHAAGTLGKLTPAPHILPKDFAAATAVNFESAWRLIRTCGPLLLIAEAGRAVFVTDALVARPRAYWGLYGATKAGMHHLALSWAEEVRNTRCRVNLYDPGRSRHGCARRRCRGRTRPVCARAGGCGAGDRGAVRAGFLVEWRGGAGVGGRCPSTGGKACC